MRPYKDEPYDQWLERVSQHEYKAAIKRISAGEDPEKVLERMSSNILKKILHPVYQSLRQEFKPRADLEESKKNYQTLYLDKTKPVADHIDDRLFDNSDKI